MNPVPRIFQILDKKGITAYKMAKDIGMSTARLSNWKQGKSTPSAEALSQIADYLGVSTDYLLGRTDDPAFTIPEYQYFSEHELTEEEKKKVDEYVELLIKARK